ncbi:element excision factor XisH family protein [Fischerella thermalis]
MSARDLFHKAVKNELQKEDWIVTDDPLEIEFEEVTEQGKSKNLMELRNKMDWLPSIDLSHLWNWVIAQTPTPTPSPLSTPAKSVNDIELLKSQLEFLKATNGQLGESFNRFVAAMQFTLVVFAFLGGVLAYAVGKNLDDAKKIASQLINREIENKITDLVQSEVESVKRSLQRERVIGSTVVDYYLPSDDTTEPDDCKLLRTRGFAKVRFCHQKRKPKKPVGDIFVLDLINSKLLEGQDFVGLSREDADNKREEKIRNQIDLALNLLDKTTVLVIYIDGFSKEVKTLATRVDYYYVAANTSITLIGIVADSAYVAHGQHNL